MPGTIYLGGGGSLDDELPLWSDMLQNVRQLLYWPFALSGELLEGADAWLRGNLADRWPAARVSTWTTLDGHAANELSQFDMLFVGGGNTFDLLEHVAGHGFMDPVRRFVGAGGSFYGGSAGAILASDSIGIAKAYDQNRTGLADLEGLGLTLGAAILPHYGSDGDDVGRRWSRTQGVTVLGLPDRSGLKIKEGQALVLGREPVHVFRETGTVVIRPGHYLPSL